MYRLREGGGGAVVTEESIGTGVVQVLTDESKLWTWKAGFGMGKTCFVGLSMLALS